MRFIPLIAAAFFLSTQNAQAFFNITDTDIKQGVLGIESRNRWDEDDRAAKDGLHMHMLKLDYGITKYVSLEAQGYVQNLPGHGYQFVSNEFETKLRFYDPGEYWLDFALKLSYEWKVLNSKSDVGKAKFLFSKSLGNWVHVANINVNKEIGDDAIHDADLTYSWRTKYKLTPYFEPGFEYYGGTGELTQMPHYDAQAHRIGPMFFGEIIPNLKYQAGYLFGLTDAAEDGSYKLFLRYEIPL